MKEYFEKYAKGIYEVTENFGPNPRMDCAAREKICDSLEARIPMEKLQERRHWRDERLTALALLKKKLDT